MSRIGSDVFARVPERLQEHIDRYELIGLLSEGEALVANAGFIGLELSYDDAQAATFDTVLFRECVFDNVDFRACTFRDVRFESCRFIRSVMDKGWLNRVDFTGCSAPGLSLLHARLAQVSARDTDLSYANLSEASVDRLRLTGCKLREAAVQRAKLKHVRLDACDLVRLDVYGTPLKGIDLSGCAFAAPVLSQDYRELRGATVSAEQAVALAQLLGVTIAE